MRRAITVLTAATAIVAGAPAPAQDAVTPERQRALYERLLETPDDVALMREYAAISFELEDYEAAIQTLERMLIYRQDLPTVRFRLGVAYYRLGALAPSRLYFEQALESGDLDAERATLAREYLDVITRREDRNAFSLVAEAGLTYHTNANLAPADDFVTVGGNPDFLLTPDSREEDDFGVRVELNAVHTYDLRLPREHAWVTDAGLLGLKFFDVEEGDTAFVRLRTGPRLVLGPFSDAARLRPYVEGQYLYAREESIFYAGLGGVELSKALGDGVSAYADLSFGAFDFEADRDIRDRVEGTLELGARYVVNPDLVGSAIGFFSVEEADADFFSNTEVGARLSGAWRYDAGLGPRRKFTLAGYVDVRYRDYEEPDPFVDPFEEREEVDLRLSLSNVVPIADDLGVKAEVEHLLRRSPIQNFDLDNTTVTLSLQYRM